jgi:hypothetical protein
VYGLGDRPATFRLNLAGVASSTKIVGVTFSFGTGPHDTVTGTPGPPHIPMAAPEPSTLAIAIVAGLGLLGHGLRREPVR